MTLTDDQGDIFAEQNFDAWGRKRNPDTWGFTGIPSVPNWLYRGYTGHEHLPDFGLIHMNGRMYDPVLGRMLSPDNYVHGSLGTQGFNRYSYAGNNPLKYSDPSGEFPVLLAAALIGGAINLGIQAYQGNIDSFQDGIVAFGIGAVAGVAGGLTGGAAVAGATSLGIVGGTAVSGGILGGVIGGVSGGAVGGFIQGAGNAIYFQNGDPLKEGFRGALWGAAIGGVIGGTVGGILAHIKQPVAPPGWQFADKVKYNIWNGKVVQANGGSPGLIAVTSAFGRTGYAPDGSRLYGFYDDAFSQNVPSNAKIYIPYGRNNPNWGHTFYEHGQHVSYNYLSKRAIGSGEQIGQFLDDQVAARFILDNVHKLTDGARDFPISPILRGRVFFPNGNVSYHPTHVRIVPGGKGVYTAFPVIR